MVIFDISNTYFETRKPNSKLTKYSKSKEKRNDCPVVIFNSSFEDCSALLDGFVVTGFSDVPIWKFGDVQIYPNPVRHVLQLAGCKSPVLLTVFDVFGKVVLSEVVSSLDSKVSVSLLESGVYFWVVSSTKRVPSASLGLTSRIGGKVVVLR